jgi:hypothetical protein
MDVVLFTLGEPLPKSFGMQILIAFYFIFDRIDIPTARRM